MRDRVGEFGALLFGEGRSAGRNILQLSADALLFRRPVLPLSQHLDGRDCEDELRRGVGADERVVQEAYGIEPRRLDTDRGGETCQIGEDRLGFGADRALQRGVEPCRARPVLEDVQTMHVRPDETALLREGVDDGSPERGGGGPFAYVDTEHPADGGNLQRDCEASTERLGFVRIGEAVCLEGVPASLDQRLLVRGLARVTWHPSNSNASAARSVVRPLVVRKRSRNPNPLATSSSNTVSDIPRDL